MASSSIQQVTGPRNTSGSIGDLRGDATGALQVGEAHGRYQEMAIRGLYHVVTPVAGVAPGTALSTTPPHILWNPPNSGVLGVLIRSRISWISGVLGLGSIVYGWTPQTTTPTGGTVLTPTSGLMSTGGGKIKAFTGSTLSATPLILQVMCTMLATVATVTTTDVFPFGATQDEVAGEITIPPGIALIIQGVAAAGTTPLVLLGTSHEEVPLAVTT